MIKYIQSSDEIVEDQGIKFNIKLLESLQNKPESRPENFSPLIRKEQVKDDPFSPPFEPGMFISDLSPSHALVFNKFSVCDCHVIIITKEFEQQINPVGFEDFRASLTVMRALDGFVFYNSGYNSGASIMHKHLQLIPYSSMSGGQLPIERCVELPEYRAGETF